MNKRTHTLRLLSRCAALWLCASILWAQTSRAERLQPIEAGAGAYPSIAVDTAGNVHLVYIREGKLWYRRGEREGTVWSEEKDTGLAAGAAQRSRPKVALAYCLSARHTRRLCLSGLI